MAEVRRAATPATVIAVDLLLSSATVLPMSGEAAILTDTSIVIDAGQILELGPAPQVRPRYAPRREINASRVLAMPGFVNGHNHLFPVRFEPAR